MAACILPSQNGDHHNRLGGANMNTRKFLVLVSAALLLAPGAAPAHDKADQLGKVTFPTSCNSKAQPLFETGVAMIHSYWFGEARKTFDAALKEDPNCAMAYWGIALDLLGNTLAAPPPVKNAQAAWEALEKARALGASGAKTPRERDWIEALSTYFRDHDKVAVNMRLAAYNKATEQLMQRYPDDHEAAVFHALTLQATAPKSDLSYANQLKSAAILEKLLTQIPEHPGVVHFLIHAYDAPPLAQKGIAAARRFAQLAPASPHALHMPSHIYTMVGLWEESIESNRLALEARNDMHHGSDFIVYAHLQLGQDAKAKAAFEYAQKVLTSGAPGFGTLVAIHTALAAMPARLVLERGDWKGAAALPLTATGSIAADSLTRFARGIGMARSGNLAGAKAEIEALQAIRAQLAKADESYWADRSEEQALAISAWIAFAEGNQEQAVKFMRAAAEREDASVIHIAMENRLYPMRELYADLLLETGQAAPALREYETALKSYPNRYRTIYGIARAAEAAGDRQKAANHYKKLLALAKNADSPRPELARARAYVAQR
jgi:tetratricopeptide (TPR) repeat protein